MKRSNGLRTAGTALVGALAALGVCLVVVAALALTGGGDKDHATTTAAATPVAQRETSGGSTSLADLYAKVQDGVAFIQAGGAMGATGSGSGFVVDADGHIVTNEHVVQGASQFVVRIGEEGKPLRAELVGADAGTDLAVLKVDPSEAGTLHPLSLGSSSDVRVGDVAIAIGSPFGLEGTLTTGIVSALGRTIQSPSGQAISGAVQTDAAINPGNSGGPLLNAAGDVVGVNAQIASQSGGNTGVGFAIPIDTVKHVLPQLQSGQGLQLQAEQQQQEDPQLVIIG